MKPRAPIERRREGVRRGPPDVPPEKWRNKAYREWLSDQPCAVCGRRPAEPAHGPVNGIGSKGPDNEAVTLCHLHHAAMHAIGSWVAFERLVELEYRSRFDRAAVAAEHWLRWEKEYGPSRGGH